MDLKEIWEKYATQAAEITAGVRPYPSDTALLCALHLEICEQLYTIAELAATPGLVPVPDQVPGVGPS